MSRRPRRNHRPAFKAKVALEAAKEEMTAAELSQKYDVSPCQITDWKRQLLDRASDVFEKGAKSEDPPVDVKTLHAKIGQLTQENDFPDSQILKAFHKRECIETKEEVTGELTWSGFRLIVAHRPDIAKEQSSWRAEKIAALEADAASWTGKLDHQDEGKVYRGRKLLDAGVTARFYKAVGVLIWPTSSRLIFHRSLICADC